MGQSTASWILIFEYEFDQNKLDESKWYTSPGRQRGSLWPNWWREEIEIGDGNLKLRVDHTLGLVKRAFEGDYDLCGFYFDVLPDTLKWACRNGVRNIYGANVGEFFQAG